MTPTQLESVRAARLQLIDHGDEKTAKLLDWAVAAEDDLDPTSKESYARMFSAACEDLGLIAAFLGVNSEIDGGAEPILESIAALRELAGYADMQVFEMDDCEWWIGPSRCACLWAFAREYDTEVSSDEIAEDAPALTEQQLADLPFYADDGTTITFAEQLAIERAKGGEFPRMFASSEV